MSFRHCSRQALGLDRGDVVRGSLMMLCPLKRMKLTESSGHSGKNGRKKDVFCSNQAGSRWVFQANRYKNSYITIHVMDGKNRTFRGCIFNGFVDVDSLNGKISTGNVRHGRGGQMHQSTKFTQYGVTEKEGPARIIYSLKWIRISDILSVILIPCIFFPSFSIFFYFLIIILFYFVFLFFIVF